MSSKDVNVVILGGCGFLGQHLISELLNEKTRDDPDETGNGDRWNIKEIKVVDVRPYDEDCLTGQRKDSEIVKYEECDIRDFEDLAKVLKGASAVFNCAAVTPNFQREDLGCGDYMNEVNVEGTKNVVKACQKLGINVLIHTSSVSVKMGGKRLIEHTESLTPEVSQDELILGDYAKGRLKAEQIVLEAHGTTTSDNSITLKTLVLRPPLMYGEGDTNFIPIIYSLAKASGNKIPSIGNPAAFTQAAYAGNIAVAHVCALKHLLSDEGKSELHSCGGLPVYVTDDSPPNNIADLTSPFLSHANIETSQKAPYWSTSLSLYLADFIDSFKAKIGLGTNEKESTLPSWPLHRFAGTIAVVSRMRAELCLGFTPVYSWEEAVKRSNLYYSRLLS